jgi:hypothetical protein
MTATLGEDNDFEHSVLCSFEHRKTLGQQALARYK